MEKNIKSAVSNVRTLAAGKYKQASTAVEDYVSDSPWIAAGIAAAVGALIGFFVARRFITPSLNRNIGIGDPQ